MKTVQLADIVEEVIAAAHSQVWCSAGTVDSHNRPHVRLLHPIWERQGEGLLGWIATGRQSPKERHLRHSPYVSLCYGKDIVHPITLDCRAEWADDVADRRRLWEMFKAAPEPLGYDPGLIWKAADDPAFGALRLTPYRIVLGHLGVEWRVWKK
ncbi:MAG: pyridoxamine 5'-phosphate oxidase family protein [Chloroflexi bacterium]|nr:pyridoxamine 5'-phosphate oxidase family protein [Chloroflexota bacterium]